MVAGPQCLNSAAGFCPQLHAFRDICAGARLPTLAANTLPARCFNSRVRRRSASKTAARYAADAHAPRSATAFRSPPRAQAPEWTPALERFPEDDARMADGATRCAGAPPRASRVISRTVMR